LKHVGTCMKVILTRKCDVGVTQVRIVWWAVVGTVMNLQIP